MTFIPSHAAQGAALRHPETAACLYAAAQNILPLLEAGQLFDTGQLRTAMAAAFGASDAEGAWDWKAAYDACEGSQVLLLRAYGRALMTRAGSSQQCLAMWERIARRIPTHTRRSQSGQSLQQFSTPLPLAYVAAQAACMRADDRVLEPSAGTGMLAIHAELAGATVVLNELDCGRAEFLAHLFPGLSVTRHDAASIDDRLDGAIRPDVVLMNPPFSAVAGVERPMRDAALRHLASALARLRDGGRLVAIVGANCSPEAAAWRDAFGALQQTAALRFSAAISGRVYAKHGTTMPTRLLVFDKVPHAGGTALLERRGEASDLATLLQWVETDLPERPDPSPPRSAVASPIPIAISSHSRGPARLPVGSSEAGGPVGDDQGELVYSTREWQSPEGRLGDTIYEPYSLQSLCIDGARPHPTALVQSAAMASVAPPRPFYRPNLSMRLVEDGTLSDAQLESVIYAGEAHSEHLSGAWAVDDHGIRFRRRATTSKASSGSGGAGSWATAPVRARGGRSRGSFLITGLRGAVVRFGCQSPIACSKMRSEIGRRLVRSGFR